MKQAPLIFLVLLSSFTCIAQTPQEMRETALTFTRQGDFSNAILVLNKALQAYPKNFIIQQDLGLNYMYSNDFAKALEYIKPLLERPEASDQVYQVAGNLYQNLGDKKEADKVYRRGIKAFPESGMLYNFYGQLLWDTKDPDAIGMFEKGIQVEPGYSKNYLNAAYYYADKNQLAWPLIYGEIFINIDPNGKETPKVKRMLLDGYKKLFTASDINSLINAERSSFGKSYLQTLSQQSSVLTQGIGAETLTMIRSRFILNWFNNPATSKFPFRLFEYQQQLLKEGYFSAYNQWLFGPVQNIQEFQNWTNTHKDDYAAFINFQKGRIFKMPSGQYYYSN